MKKFSWVVVVGIIAVAGFIWHNNRPVQIEEDIIQQNDNQNNSSNNGAQNFGNNDQNEASEQDDAEDGSVLRGTLQTSNDTRHGNLMLLLEDSDRIIYFNTSRDFSSLIGKNVKVEIDGDLNNFVLINIEENDDSSLVN